MQQRGGLADQRHAMTSNALFGPRHAFALSLTLTPIVAACAAQKDTPVEADDGASSSEDGMPASDGAVNDDDTVNDDGMADDDDTGADDANPADDTGPGTGADGSTDDGSDDQPAEDTGPVTPTCADEDGICTLDFPDEWEGPVAMITWADGEETPECAGGYDIPVALSLSNALSAPDAACTCECGDASGGSCEGELSIFRTALVQGGCFPLGAVEVTGIEANSAETISETGPIGLALDDNIPPTYSGGSCNASDSESVPPATFASHVALCAATPLEGECDEDTLCMPTAAPPQSEAVCIWQAGDAACPSGWGYDDRTVVYQGIDDDRGCSDCSCGSPSGACTDGSVQFFGTSTNPSIPFPPQIASAPDGCAPILASIWTAVNAVWTGVLPTDEVGCNPIGGTPVGDAIGTDPITVCCYDPQQD